VRRFVGGYRQGAKVRRHQGFVPLEAPPDAGHQPEALRHGLRDVPADQAQPPGELRPQARPHEVHQGGRARAARHSCSKPICPAQIVAHPDSQ